MSTTEQVAAAEILSVVVGAGIVEVLQLDDPSIRAADGISVEFLSRKKIRVSGTRKSLRSFQKSCSAGESFEGPLWYKASARAAQQAIAKLIGPLHPNWFLVADNVVEEYALKQLAK